LREVPVLDRHESEAAWFHGVRVLSQPPDIGMVVMNTPNWTGFMTANRRAPVLPGEHASSRLARGVLAIACELLIVSAQWCLPTGTWRVRRVTWWGGARRSIWRTRVS
jgi:hypothetical protein